MTIVERKAMMKKVENANGIIRQFFKRDGKFEGITGKMVTSVKNLLNRRPGKVLNYATPKEGFIGKIFGVNCVLKS